MSLFLKKVSFKRIIAVILSMSMVLSLISISPQGSIKVEAESIETQTIKEETIEAETAESETIQYYKDGVTVASTEAYDGYVQIKQVDDQVTVTPVAATNYKFSTLNLTSKETDNEGYVFTPLSRDYVKSDSDSEEFSDTDTRSYTFTVDETQTYSAGSIYTAIPDITAYFDPTENVLNETLLSNATSGNDAVVTGWLSGKISAGTEKWSCLDTTSDNTYAVFDAGEDKVFHITDAVLYSRLQWSDTRFGDAAVEISSDGNTFEQIAVTKNVDTKEQYSTVRMSASGDYTGRYLRLSSKWRLTDITYVGICGTVEDKSFDSRTYQFYKNGEKVAEADTPETSAEYDGYIQITKKDATCIIKPVAAEGYEFSLLNLISKEDGSNDIYTPLSRDYVKSGDEQTNTTGNHLISDGKYEYTFSVDEAATYVNGEVYTEMPDMAVYFDSTVSRLNDNLVETYACDGNNAAVSSWLTGKISGGGNPWSGIDAAGNTYAVYDAGEGNVFRITDAVIYGRFSWANTRFDKIKLQVSNDGSSYTDIVSTSNRSASEKYSTARQQKEGDTLYTGRYLRLYSTYNLSNVSYVGIYGSVESEDAEYDSVSYLFYKNGEVVATQTNKEAPDVEYDGYVKVMVSKTKVTVYPVAAENREFSLLNLISESNQVFTPVSRDYIKTGTNSSSLVSNGVYGYTFTVDSTASYVNGEVYQSMPSVSAYFDSTDNVLNTTLQDYAVDGNDSKVAGWLTGKISAGANNWSGADPEAAVYAAYDAGEGYQFNITSAVFYGRWSWADTRFNNAKLQVSNDGVNYETILFTSNRSINEKYSTPREEIGKTYSGRYVRLFCSNKYTNISLASIYGSRVEAGEEVVFDRQNCLNVVTTDKNPDILAEKVIIGDLVGDSTVPYWTTNPTFIQYAGNVIAFPVALTVNGESIPFNMFTASNATVTYRNSEDSITLGNEISDTSYKMEDGIFTWQPNETGNYRACITVNYGGKDYVTYAEIMVKKDASAKVDYKYASIHYASTNEVKEVDLGFSKNSISKDNKAFILEKDSTLAAFQNLTATGGTAQFADSEWVPLNTKLPSEGIQTLVLYLKNTCNVDYIELATGLDNTQPDYQSVRIEAEQYDYRSGVNGSDSGLLFMGTSIAINRAVSNSYLAYNNVYLNGEGKAGLGTLTDYQVEFIESEDTEFSHPGVVVTAEQLNNIRNWVEEGKEPWLTYYNVFRKGEYASKSYEIQNDANPSSELTDLTSKYGYKNYNSGLMENQMQDDAYAAFYQSVLYYITGDEQYREKALRIVRLWSDLNPQEATKVTDGHIKMAYPVYYMCAAAEILRYTTCQDERLAWTQEDTDHFITNYLEPPLKLYMYGNEYFYNQHHCAVTGSIAAYLFMGSDYTVELGGNTKTALEFYKEAVEWISVNANTTIYSTNGSISNAFRKYNAGEIYAKDSSGVSSLLTEDLIVVAEMGRDQPHSNGDISGVNMLITLCNAQGTKVDPTTGEASNAFDAVNMYEFLNNRLLKAANYYCKYNLGYDVLWVDEYDQRNAAVLNKPEDQNVALSYYPVISDYARGRLYHYESMYYYYKYQLHINDDDPDMQYLAEEVHYNPISDNEDWLFIPEEAAEDESFVIPKAQGIQSSYRAEVEERFTDFSQGDAVVSSDNAGSSYVSMKADQDGTRITLLNERNWDELVSIRVKTDGEATLNLYRDWNLDPIYSLKLPDTKGEWTYISFSKNYIDLPANKFISDFSLLYMEAVGNGDTQVGIDYLSMNGAGNCPIPVFENKDAEASTVDDGQCSKTFATFAGHTFSTTFKASRAINYSLMDAPEGATIDAYTGAFTWDIPENASEKTTFYVAAFSDEYTAVLKVTLNIDKDLMAAIAAIHAVYDENEVYMPDSLSNYLTCYEEITAKEIITDADLDTLKRAAVQLELVTPKLSDGSINYLNLVSATINKEDVSHLLDNDNTTFCGDLFSDAGYGFTIDTGEDFRISAASFEVQARANFPNRTKGMTVKASNDGENWDVITEEAVDTSDMQTLQVKEQYCNTQYRYFKFSYSPTNTQPFSISELRIFGTRYIAVNKLSNISVSTNSAYGNYAVKGDMVTLNFAAEGIKDVEVTIEGQTAEVSSDDGVNYTASVTLEINSNYLLAVKFAINYFCEDGTQGTTAVATMDGSFVYVSTDEGVIDNFTDTEGLKVQIYAGNTLLDLNDSWKKIFDKDTSIRSYSEWYGGGDQNIVFDFGEGNGIRLSNIELLARPNRTDLVNRINGVYVQASNDASTWESVSSSTAAETLKWQSLGATNKAKNHHYRYLRLNKSGNWFGNMGELRLFGAVEAFDPADEIEKYSVTFDSLGGSSVDTQTLTLGSKITKPIDPSKAGYTFAGWYSDAEGTTAWDFDNNTVAESITLYAKWTKNNTVNYTVSFNSMGGSGVASQIITAGTRVMLPNNPTRTGYVFDGWYADAAYTTAWNFDTSIVSSDTILYAKWNEIKVSSVAQSMTSVVIDKGSSYALKAIVTPSDALNPGLNWTSSNTKIATVSSNGVVAGVGYGSTTINATAQDGSGKSASVTVSVGYAITYKLNGGTNHTDNPSAYYKQKVTFKNPSRAGYKFSGWYTDKKFEKSIKSISKSSKKNYTVYAKWTKIKASKAAISNVKNKKAGQLAVAITKISGVSGYEIQYATNSKSTQNSNTVTLKKTSAKIKSLVKGTTYYVRVRAYTVDSAGGKVYGKYSSSKKIKITK